MLKKANIIEVYTDGSHRREKTGEVSGYGIYFPNKELSNVSGAFTLEPLTNNRAELYAIYRAIRKIEDEYEFNSIIIHTDSEYSMNSTTKWIVSWKANNWKTAKKKPVENQDLIKKIDGLLQKHNGKIQIRWVKAHSTNPHNIEADRLANKGSDMFKQKFIKI